jgi:DNA (cytosine-5)-methyltransferase 1
MYRGHFQLGANLRTGRLPILTFQTWLARQDLLKEKRLATAVAGQKEAEWRDALNSLATRGWSKDDFDHWVWILSGENGDDRVQRLISTYGPKPIFLLLLLLRSDETFRKAESLPLLMRYAYKHHMTPTPRPSDAKEDNPTVDPKMILNVSQFLILMRRLVYHVQKVWPRSIVTVARLTANYIRSIPNDPHHRRHRRDYYDQCLIYNSALSCFKKPASNNPLANMEFNWRAQRVLLTMSDGLNKSLIINTDSYRAIRQVLIGLKKSGKERAVALRYAKSWPPYRQDFDGRDTKRTVEDDQSRSVKAGILMKEAGYPDDHYDRALDALGGAGEGSPTIQTRSLPPSQWKGDKEESNLYSNWAMQVRATRNAQEAWRVFNKLAKKWGLAPNLQVYTEMFLKLHAAPVNPDSESTLLPGDSPETFPVHNANYSEYELARLSPPTVAELYTEMMNRGIRPRGHSLYTLVSHARSVEEGLRYLEDSGIPSDVVRSVAISGQPSYQTLRRIPLLSFNCYIQLLCRLQPDRRGRDKLSDSELYRIPHAIKLVSTRLSPDTTEGATFRPPWYAILRALARPHIAVKNGLAIENDLEALRLFMQTFESVRKCIGIDAELFILLCRIVQKAAVSRLNSAQTMEHPEAPLIPYAQNLLRITTSMFLQLTTPFGAEDSSSLPIPQFQFPLAPPHLHSYMRALAFLEAKDDMVDLVVWMLDNYKQVNKEADRLTGRGQAMIAKTFCCFYAFAGPALGGDEQQELANRMDRLVAQGGSWRWPTPEEVENYVGSDLRGGSRPLQRRIVASSCRKSLWEDEDNERPKAAAA